MTALIVEYVPYIAFFAAGLLVAWAVVDLLVNRRPKAAGKPQEPARGVSASVQPLVTQELHPEPAEVAPSAELAKVADSAPAPAVPVSQAVELVPQSSDTVRDEPVPESAVMAAASERSEVLVRRDPSVRVFDTAVAPSERKVLAD